MKNIYNQAHHKLLLLLLAVMLVTGACKKDNDAPTPTLEAISPGQGSGGEVLTLTGSGLNDMRAIVFDKNNVPASFTPTLNTDHSLVFRVPDTAFGGPQNIIFTNSAGKQLTVPFNVVALPTISTAFPTDFETGTTVTITGNNLDDVSKVVLDGTTDAAVIVSKSRKQLVITMPATTIARAKLKITNASGDRLTDMEFVNVAQAFGFFKDDFGVDNWSWGGDYTAVPENAVTGTRSLKAAYTGSWGGLSLHSDAGVTITGYKFITFWAKGADIDRQVDLKVNWGPTKTFTITAGIWTYYKIPIDGFLTGITKINDFVLQIHDDGKTIYYDNILLVK
ncbi:MAG: IPT/TIG domain-containing protein [Chitinophagaceae bacterium]